MVPTLPFLNGLWCAQFHHRNSGPASKLCAGPRDEYWLLFQETKQQPAALEVYKRTLTSKSKPRRFYSIHSLLKGSLRAPVQSLALSRHQRGKCYHPSSAFLLSGNRTREPSLKGTKFNHLPGCQEETNKLELFSQPENNSEKDGWFRHFIRRSTEASHYYFLYLITWSTFQFFVPSQKYAEKRCICYI